MARQKSAPRTAASKKAPRPPSSTAYGRASILLEEMRASFEVIAEGQAQTREEVFRTLQAMDERIGERFASLEFAVRDVVSRVVAHDEMLKAMNSKLDDHTRILGDHTKKLDDHTRRHDETLEKLDDQARTLATHSARLEQIEAKLDRKADAEDLARLGERVSRLEQRADGT